MAGVAISEDSDSGTFFGRLSSRHDESELIHGHLPSLHAQRAVDSRGYIALAATASGPPRGAAISTFSAATSRSGSSELKTRSRADAQRLASVASTRSLIVTIWVGCIEKLRKPMLLYAISRFIIEFYRGDERGNVGVFSTSQFISVLLAPLAIGMLVYLSRAITPEPKRARKAA